MDFALLIEPNLGMTYGQQLRLAQRAESAGFDTLYRSDHYQCAPGPEGLETTDAWAVIAGLVRETNRIRHGTLVSPVTFRHPGNLAKIVATIDHMSDGRVDLGLGSGWFESEHRQYGFAFPDMPTRVDMLEEQLAVITGLWGEPDGWSFHGSHYRVAGSQFVPRPLQQPRPPIILGTRGASRGIRLAARYADELNVYQVGPSRAGEIFAGLDAACRSIGRNPRSVRHSVLLGAAVGDDGADADRRLAAVMRLFEFDGSADQWKAESGDFWLLGKPAHAEQTVAAFAAAGAERVVFQDFIADDLPMIDLLGSLAGAWAGMASTTAGKTAGV
ncbi:MAG: TIGR03560 family F420-dependent LLM class oxidoreductase [Chloroflexota bacterium]|nr:TIGR03560 family F420-dependent LLM class oxidoreductase [Chloroflexota bacterium]